jgi:CRISPR-associated protein Cas1
MDDDAEEIVPISMVVHYLYCPRRVWLEAQGEHTDTYQMQAGISAHRRADVASCHGSDEVRSVDICSQELGVSGRTDVIKLTEGGVRIREYKGTPVRREAVVTPGMRVQLALQQLCLEEMGARVDGTEIYFTDHNVIRDVILDDSDFACARESVSKVRKIISSDYSPESLDDTSRCGSCSHADVCLPDEHKLTPVRRQIRPRVNQGRVVYLTTQGAYAHLRKGRMVVTFKKDELAQVPLETVQAVQVHGNVTLSGGLIRELLERDIPIQWCTNSGRLSGWAMPSYGPNGTARNAQHVLSQYGSLSFASEFIGAKISNQATQIRRAGASEGIVGKLRDYQKKCQTAHSIEELMGVEGRAASVYFEHWDALIKEPLRSSWNWPGKRERPATDPVNSMLNYAYSLLTADEVRAITACGLDPHAGFLHSSRRNKPALALDLMEEVRAPIADSAVQTVINCQMVSPNDFESVLGSVRMSRRARGKLIEAYERRMETEFEHPLFHYKMTWRRALEVQARQVLGVLEHSQDRYVGIRVR